MRVRWKLTFELRDDVGQVVLQLAVGGQVKAHVVLRDSGEGLRRVNPSLVQDAVDPERYGSQTEASFTLGSNYTPTAPHD